MIVRRSLLAGLAALVFAAGSIAVRPASAQDKPVVVFAAASMKNALDEVVAKWKADTGKVAVVSYAASGPLARQLEQGAPADMFISADLEWMNYAEKKGLIKADTRTNLLGNTLVLIAPASSTGTFKLEKGANLAAFVGDGRLAVGDVRSVPAGRYAEQGLTYLGMWDQVKDKLAQAESVRATLALVSRGEAPAGIVYATDAKIDKNVRVVATFPAGSHPPVVYPVALTASTQSADAAALLAYLKTPAAAVIFEKYGFSVCGVVACGKAA